MIPKGMVSTFWLELLYSALALVMILRARRGLKIPAINKVPGLEAIDEAIGRATEMGRPIHYSPGSQDVSDAETLASFAILSHVAKQAARYRADLIVTNKMAVVYSITEEIVRNAYAEAGKLGELKQDAVRFFAEDQWAYASACVGLIERSKPAANILIGAFEAEALMFAEAGSHVNAIQIAGTAKTSQIPFFVVACDYCLIGEEMFAAGAYLSQDPDRLGTLVAQDVGKMVAIGAMLVGLVWAAIAPKSNLILKLLKY